MGSGPRAGIKFYVAYVIASVLYFSWLAVYLSDKSDPNYMTLGLVNTALFLLPCGFLLPPVEGRDGGVYSRLVRTLVAIAKMTIYLVLFFMPIWLRVWLGSAVIGDSLFSSPIVVLLYAGGFLLLWSIPAVVIPVGIFTMTGAVGLTEAGYALARRATWASWGYFVFSNLLFGIPLFLLEKAPPNLWENSAFIILSGACSLLFGLRTTFYASMLNTWLVDTLEVERKSPSTDQAEISGVGTSRAVNA